jgi:putative copper export protein
MISPTLDSLRITLHVLAATVWVGGQIVLGAIVPKLRKAQPEALRVVANGFARVAWPAFIVAVFTGMWSIFDLDVASLDSSYHATLGIKVVAVALAGFAAAAHSTSQSKLVIALGGAIGLLASLGALYLGVLLSSAT